MKTLEQLTKDELVKELIKIIATEPTAKELAELAGSSSANISTIKSRGSKTYTGYVARSKLEKIERLLFD